MKNRFLFTGIFAALGAVAYLTAAFVDHTIHIFQFSDTLVTLIYLPSLPAVFLNYATCEDWCNRHRLLSDLISCLFQAGFYGLFGIIVGAFIGEE